MQQLAPEGKYIVVTRHAQAVTVAESHLEKLLQQFAEVRRQTEQLVAPLEPGDCEAQSMPDASPAKWHLAHTSWFFETFVLGRYQPDFEPYDARYGYLFNSYYNAVGARHQRHQRGLLTRPTLTQVLAYRRAVTERVLALLTKALPGELSECAAIIELGCHHEQQHQELLLTDIKHLFAQNPLYPAYRSPLALAPATTTLPPLRFSEFAAGLYEIGCAATGFAFDNERPRHRVYVAPFAVANRLVSNGEYREFIADGGYRRPELWLDAGYQEALGEGWDKPLYWREHAGGYREFTLAGLTELHDAEPVSHVSYYEADAYARWAGARLAREEEWEVACRVLPEAAGFLESGRYHPDVAASSTGLEQCYGELWQWTASPYLPYPGYRAAAGALGEYNGKFMCDQWVLRGGSRATPRSHIRSTYRNFFYAKARWQFSGIRLAKDG